MDTLIERPYQTEGIAWLAERNNALLAFDPRLGKTLVAMRAASKVGAKRILVLCPAIGRISWAIELKKLGVTLPVYVMRPGGRLSAVGKGPLVLVVAYDALSRTDSGALEVLLSASRWDVLICDESQYLKSPTSNRTKAVFGHGDTLGLRLNADRVWLLSGTPTPNHAGEIWAAASALWPEDFPESRIAFEDKYCKVKDTKFGRQITGSRNAEELRTRLAPHVMRRTRKQVMAELPGMSHHMVPIEVEKSLPFAPGAFASDAELEKLLARPMTSTGLDDGKTTSVQRALGEAKAPGMIAWITEQLREGIIPGKLLVFAWHRTVMDALMEGLKDYEPVRIDGASSDKEKTDAVRAFQMPGTACRVLVGQIKACGTALCLDAADDVVMAEPSWVPGDNYQAACRAESLAQHTPVNVSWLYTPDTLDERIIGTIRAKTKQISELWDKV